MALFEKTGMCELNKATCEATAQDIATRLHSLATVA